MACAYIRVTLALCAAPGLGVRSRRTISLSASLSPDAEIRAASCITVGETARRTGAGDVDGDLPLTGLPGWPLSGLSSSCAASRSLHSTPTWKKCDKFEKY